MEEESNSNELSTSAEDVSTSIIKVFEDTASWKETDSDTFPTSNLQSHPMDKIVLDMIDKYHTRRATQWALFCWNTWRLQQTEEFPDKPLIPYFVEMCKEPIDKLDDILAVFIVGCRNKEGEEYSPDTLRGVLFGLQRFLKTYCRNIKTTPVSFIKNEFQFPKYCQALKKKLENLVETGVTRKNAQGITHDQEEYLWNRGIFGCTSAEVLSNTVFFYIVKIFGIVSSNALRTMKTNTFIFGENDLGKYVELDTDFANELDIYNATSCCHNLALLATSTATKLRHYCNENNPRTFYNILKYYVEIVKLVDSAEKCLFFKPKRDMMFSHQAIGRNQLQRKFCKMMNSAQFQGYFTTQALVQSCLDSLQVKGFMVRKKQTFFPHHQLEISKHLDPPAGIIRTLDVKTQTKAVLQLVKANMGIPVQQTKSVLDVNQLQYVYQLNQPAQPNTLLNVNQVQSQINEAVKLDRMDIDSVLHAGLSPSLSASYASTVSVLTNQLTAANNPIPNKMLAISTILPSSNHTTSTASVAMKAGDEISECETEAFPMFLSKADNDNSLNEPQDDSEVTNDYEFENIIIKQEPTDYEGECFQSSESSNHDMNVTYNQVKYANESEIHLKRKIETNQHDDKSPRKTARSKTDVQSNHGLKNSHIGKKKHTDLIEANESVTYNAEIEYSFNNDLAKKITKQEISLKEEDQTMFCFTGTSKMGRSMGDLDINLGDYLPDNCTIKPGDIDLKRMILPDGGKMVIKLKYTLDK